MSKTIEDLQGEEYTLCSFDGDVLELNSNYQTDYDGFLVKIGNGDYEEVWGFYGSIPWLNKTVHNVLQKGGF